jgi:TolB-like protein
LPVCALNRKQLMEKDRRSAPRARVKLQARWEGVHSRENATVTDLSRSGCFVLTGGKVEVKELVRLEIQLTDDQTVNLWAEVVDEASEIGFALKFNSSSSEDEAALARFLEGIFQGQGQQKA